MGVGGVAEPPVKDALANQLSVCPALAVAAKGAAVASWQYTTCRVVFGFAGIGLIVTFIVTGSAKHPFELPLII